MLLGVVSCQFIAYSSKWTEKKCVTKGTWNMKTEEKKQYWYYILKWLREVLLHWFVLIYGGQYVAANVLFVSHLCDTIVRMHVPSTMSGEALFTASDTQTRYTQQQRAHTRIDHTIHMYAHIIIPLSVDLLYTAEYSAECWRTKERKKNLRTRDTLIQGQRWWCLLSGVERE